VPEAGDWRPFDEARAFVRGLGLRSSLEWQEWSKSGERPVHIPASPRDDYPDEWCGWKDWLGTDQRTTRRGAGSSFAFEVSILQRDPTGKPVGSSHSDAGGRSATAYPSADDQMDVKIKGSPAKGESPVGSACKELLDHLRAKDEAWKALVNVSDQGSRDEQGVDCYLEHSSGRKLAIQVTRAVSNPKYRREIDKASKRGDSFKDSFKVSELVEQLRCSIDKKADRILPKTGRREITLVLDATDAPQVAASSVVRSFRDQYESWSRSLGFEGVWVVGRSVDLVFRLDCAEDQVERGASN
jgi:hypothetical protein